MLSMGPRTDTARNIVDAWAAVLSPPEAAAARDEVGIGATQRRLALDVLRAARVLVWLGVVVAVALAVMICRVSVTGSTYVSAPLASAVVVSVGTAVVRRRRR